MSDVVFLGAGASASEGAPIQNSLFKEFFSATNGYIYNDELKGRLKSFLIAFFGIDIDENISNSNFPTFEEILGILELAIDRKESFRGYSITPLDPKVQTLREDFIFLIAIILKEKLLNPKGFHHTLVNRLVREGTIRKTTFISLNYDILIDNALAEAFDDIDLDYGVSFTNFGKKNDWRAPKRGRGVNLFKLHGSLNWLYCPTCVSLTLTPKEKSVATIVDRPMSCKKCNTNTIPIIIPPTFFKVMSNHYLQNIWRKTEISLSKADRIIFCGYSFPDADIHIKYLLKRIEINNSKSPEIIIINNHDGKSLEDKASEESRYRRFFSDKNKIYYLDKSFQEFCQYGVDVNHLQ